MIPARDIVNADDLDEGAREELLDYEVNVRLRVVALPGIALFVQIGIVMAVSLYLANSEIDRSAIESIRGGNSIRGAQSAKSRQFALTLTAIEDVEVRQRVGTDNYGDASSIEVRMASGWQKQALLKFKMPELTDYQIKSVALVLSLTESLRGPAPAIKVVDCGTSWHEHDLTWASRPERAMLLGFLPEMSQPDAGDDIGELSIQLDVSALSQGGLLGLRVESMSDKSGIVFHSRESIGDPPRLVVTVTGDTPPPTSASATVPVP